MNSGVVRAQKKLSWHRHINNVIILEILLVPCSVFTY